jgi:hypothetical protein
MSEGRDQVGCDKGPVILWYAEEGIQSYRVREIRRFDQNDMVCTVCGNARQDLARRVTVRVDERTAIPIRDILGNKV